MSNSDEHGTGPSRRGFLGGLGLALGAAVAAPAALEAAAHHHHGAYAISDAALAAHIHTVVVIYAENRSFNNLFANFPGLRSPLAAVPPERYRQRDRDGSLLPHLPDIWNGLTATPQTVGHRHYDIGPDAITGLANAPFALQTPDGEPLPHGLVTRDLIHAFYENQSQINGGANDGFVAWGDSGALVMGHYGTSHAHLRLWQLAREFTLCDNFFMGAFGGSFINHQYLVAARPPAHPDAATNPALAKITADLADGPTGTLLRLADGTKASALDGPAKFKPSVLSPDGYAVNTMQPPFAPAPRLDPARPGFADPANLFTLPAQTHANIGDLLSGKGIGWAWYAGGWQAALDGHGTNTEFPQRPNFQTHHQPFNYFAAFAPGTPARAEHLRDGGVGDTAQTNNFLADVGAGRLPPVSFYKPQGNLNMHAGYSDIDDGDRHIASVIAALRQSPQWHGMLVVIAFDENGGWWDHVAPPKGDRWGPGTRVPALIVSPHARKGAVDHTLYDTGSIARLITRRFGLPKLPGLAEREAAMVEAGGVAPGDLTGALALA